MAEKLMGKIKWYNDIRGFGLVTGNDGKEYFLHESNLPSNLEEPKIGARLIFDVLPRPPHKGGQEAVKVELDTSPIQLPAPIKTFTPVTESQDPVTDYWYQSYSSANSKTSFPSKPTVMETTVVGVTYEGRQAIVALLTVGEKVLLIREPDNPYDCNAIKVTRENGQCFGYISKDLAATLTRKFDNYGQPVEATVKTIKGGYSADASLGVSIQFTLPESRHMNTNYSP